MMRYDRVAVTGGSGHVGRHVVAALKEHAQVTVVDRVPPADGIDFARADVLDRDALFKALAGHDAVLHLAGLDAVMDSSPDQFLTVNAVGTWNVLEAAEALGAKRTVVCSSIAATGLGESRPDWPPQYLPVDEDHPLRPEHPYSVSKQLAETVAETFRARGRMEVLSLRPMLVLLPHFYERVHARAADPASRWLFYYVTPEDCARAFRCALEAERPRFPAYFVSAADSCHADPTLALIEARLGSLPPVRRPDLYARNPRAGVFDISRARDDLGFEPASNWPELAR